MVEMIVTISLMTILLSMAAGAMTYYFAGRSLDVAVREVTTEVREAQAMAVSTGNMCRISFGDSSYQVSRLIGGEWQNDGNALELPSGVHVSSASFNGDGNLDFYARGEAEDGQLMLRGKFGMTRTIRVDGATVNVSETG